MRSVLQERIYSWSWSRPLIRKVIGPEEAGGYRSFSKQLYCQVALSVSVVWLTQLYLEPRSFLLQHTVAKRRLALFKVWRTDDWECSDVGGTPIPTHPTSPSQCSWEH